MKHKKVWLLITSIMICIISLFTITYAFNINSALGGARDFESGAIGYAIKSNLDFVKELTAAAQAVGTIVALCSGIIIAMRLMADSSSANAKAKEALTPYIVGVTILYGAFGIWDAAVSTFQDITPPASSGTYVESTLRQLVQRLFTIKPMEHTPVNGKETPDEHETKEKIGKSFRISFWEATGLVSANLSELLDNGAILGGDSWASLGGYETTNRELAKTNAERLISNDNIHYMGRYVNKHISNEEIDGACEGGMLFFCIFEVNTGDYQEVSMHTTWANRAYDCATDLGVPDGAIIYFAIDTDAGGLGHYSAVENYIRTVARTFESKGGKYKVGVYGGAAIVSYLYENASDVCKGFWQCMAWSYGKVFENYTLYQGSCGLPTSAGFLVDRNACPDLAAATVWNRDGLWTKKGL